MLSSVQLGLDAVVLIGMLSFIKSCSSTGEVIPGLAFFGFPIINGVLGVCSNGYDLLKSKPKPRIKSSSSSPSLEKDKSEKDLKDKK